MGNVAPLLAAAGALAGCLQTWAGPEPTVTAYVGSSGPLRLEVADSGREKGQGLMGRTEVPTGTGMAFRYVAPHFSGFYMYRTLVPLTAVFASGGVVVHVAEMVPCPSQDPAQCPVYLPPVPYDLVVETAPQTLAGHVDLGDRVRVER